MIAAHVGGNLMSRRFSAIALFLLAFPVKPDAIEAVPIASRIAVSVPDASHQVNVVGTAGAVESGSDSFVATVETGHYAIAKAQADGSFRATLIAPRGSSIMVKSDRSGRFARLLAEEPQLDAAAAAVSLFGTILPPVEAPVGTSFAGAGTVDAGGFWTATGDVNALEFAAGERIDIRATFTIVHGSLAGTPPIEAKIRATLHALARSDGTGTLAQSSFCSTGLTPTELPIERFTFDGAPRDGDMNRVLAPTASGATTTFALSLPIPAGFPAGYYRPLLVFNLSGVPPEANPQSRIHSIDPGHRREHNQIYLPIVRIGAPSPPRFPAALLVDAVIEGARGVTAVEDRGAFGIASHIITSADVLVVPRTNPGTGQAIEYLLEAYALTIGLSDRSGLPNAPLIPFRFPSGQLIVRIEKPGGGVQMIGPVPFRQWRFGTPSDSRGHTLDNSGHITHGFQLTTLDPRFAVTFDREGKHRIVVEASVEDVFGTIWRSGGTYEVWIGRTLLLDTATLPGSVFEVGDVIHAGTRIIPPVSADVSFRIRHAPNSDRARMIARAFTGRANSFGEFHPASTAFAFDDAGEYRVDVTASYVDASGNHWFGARTWGGVVAPRNSPIIAHGHRGTDNQPLQDARAWFSRGQLPADVGHVNFPFHSGDVMWMEKSHSTTPQVNFQDSNGVVLPIIDGVFAQAGLPLRYGPTDTSGELPLHSANANGRDPHIDRSDADIVAYAYRSVQRPLVRVREIIGEGHLTAPYWRFSDRYASQTGSGANGDLVNDFKFQFGGVVLRGRMLQPPRYAIYNSLFVLVPDSEPGGGTRVFPPFQGNGSGPSGGPLMKLHGKEVDIFFHSTALRPGSILQQGNIASFAGYVGPTLAAKLEIVVTSPSGAQRLVTGQANRVGYFYVPSNDFEVDEAGVWRAAVKVWFDAVLPSSSGQVTPPYPTGSVPGLREGSFVFFVVEPNSRLSLQSLPRFVRPAESRITFQAVPPAGWRDLQLSYVTMMPGFVLETGKSSGLVYEYDASRLAGAYPNLDLRDGDDLTGVDVVTISLLLSGIDASGARAHRAAQVVLRGEELHAPESSRRRSVRSTVLATTGHRRRSVTSTANAP